MRGCHLEPWASALSDVHFPKGNEGHSLPKGSCLPFPCSWQEGETGGGTGEVLLGRGTQFVNTSTSHRLRKRTCIWPIALCWDRESSQLKLNHNVPPKITLALTYPRNLRILKDPHQKKKSSRIHTKKKPSKARCSWRAGGPRRSSWVLTAERQTPRRCRSCRRR